MDVSIAPPTSPPGDDVPTGSTVGSDRDSATKKQRAWTFEHEADKALSTAFRTPLPQEGQGRAAGDEIRRHRTMLLVVSPSVQAVLDAADHGARGCEVRQTARRT